MRLSGKFTFHSVGQGLFYSGVIDIDGMKRHIVYDCGSFFDNELLNHEINDAFKPNDTIDILVISHMDEDHISGIRQLLKAVRHVHFMFMPYTEPEELAFLAVKYESSRNENKHKDYIDTIRTFEDVISDKKIQNVIMLTDSDDDSDSLIDNIDSTEGVSSKFRFKFKRDEGKQENLEKISPKRKIHAAKHDGLLDFRDAWNFRFYVRDDRDEKREKLHEDLTAIGLKITSFAELRNVLESKEDLKKLKAVYKSIDSDLNLASVVLLHSPLENRRFLLGLSRLSPCMGSKYFPGMYSQCKTLLLGDAKLSDKKACNDLKEYFGYDLEDCGIALVPHHGSKRSWYSGLLEDIIIPFWIVSYGVHGKYGHPSTEVLRDFGRSWEYAHGCKGVGTAHKKLPCLLYSDEYRSVQYEILEIDKRKYGL